MVKVKRKVHTDGLRVNASRLGPRDPKRPGGVMGDLHGVRSEQEGVEDGDEGGVGQVKEGLGGGRTHVDIKAREWRPLGVGGFLGLGLKTEVGVRRDRAARRTRGVITEVASRRSGVAIPSLQSDERWKKMDKSAPAWVKWL